MGGYFRETPSRLSHKLFDIKGFLFDWDGVFNNGRKSESSTSTFSEGNSMGINMLRFSFYLKHGFNPKIFIVTGEKNPTAFKLAEREHFDGAFFNVKHKPEVLPLLLDSCEIEAGKWGFFYDDILDLSLAEVVGFRCMIKNLAAPLLEEQVKTSGLADYITYHDGGGNGLREACELLIGLNGNYEETVQNRMEFSSEYQSYLKNRRNITPSFYTHDGKGFTAINGE